MNTTLNTTNSQNWTDRISESDTFVKDMLSFFQEGWDARGVDDQTKIVERLRANVILTLTYIDEVISFLNKMNLKANKAFIRGESLVSQVILISVPLEDYLNPNFLKVYKVANDIERNSRSENYSVSFNFTFDEGNLCEESIQTDGFVKTHAFKN